MLVYYNLGSGLSSCDVKCGIGLRYLQSIHNLRSWRTQMRNEITRIWFRYVFAMPIFRVFRVVSCWSELRCFSLLRFFGASWNPFRYLRDLALLFFVSTVKYSRLRIYLLVNFKFEACAQFFFSFSGATSACLSLFIWVSVCLLHFHTTAVPVLRISHGPRGFTFEGLTCLWCVLFYLIYNCTSVYIFYAKKLPPEHVEITSQANEIL